jgi:molecular chaperone DnaJ
MDDRDCYATLGVPTGASEHDIRAAYRRLARRFHPDLHPGDARAAELFKRIKAAYETLADPGRRRRYDELRAGRGPAPPARPARTGAGARGQPRPVSVRRFGVGLTVELGLGLSSLLDPIGDVRVGARRPADGG